MRPSTMLVLRSVTICATSHWRCALASPTRNGRTFAAGTGVNPAQPNSSSSRGKSPEVKVHPLQQVHRHDVGDEFRHLTKVSEAVLDAGRAEGDVGRVAPHQIEIRIGRQVAYPALGNGRDPADRPRHHQCRQQLVKGRALPVVGAHFESAIEVGGRGLVGIGHAVDLFAFYADAMTGRSTSSTPRPPRAGGEGGRFCLGGRSASYFAATGSSSAYISGSTVRRQVSWRGKIFSM